MKDLDPDVKSPEQLDQRIHALEKELAELRLTRRRQFGTPPDWTMGDPFFVRSADEFTLDALPDLARMILDALPVSVFIKHAEAKEGLGRRFTYINARARRLMPKGPWTELEVRDNDDGQAFAGGFDSPQYQVMLNQETQTLAGGKSRETELEWQPSSGFWRRARTREIPIFKLAGGTQAPPIGFCAIANEDDHLVLPFIQSWLQKVITHEYFNVYSECVNYIEKAVRPLQKVQGKPTRAAISL